MTIISSDSLSCEGGLYGEGMIWAGIFLRGKCKKQTKEADIVR